MDDVWDIRRVPPIKQLYPTEKPEVLIERILRSSTQAGDTGLDAYCGCGTTVAVAQALKLKWIGIDLTYQSIAGILKGLEDHYGKAMVDQIILDGIPLDKASANALANKTDDRVRKEFEKWAIRTFSNNRAQINDKKGADGGIDGTAFFMTGPSDNGQIVFQAKSGNVGRGEVSKFNNDRERVGAELGYFTTVEPPTKPMEAEARAAGSFDHKVIGRKYLRIEFVTIQEIIEQKKRLAAPLGREVLREAQAKAKAETMPVELDER